MPNSFSFVVKNGLIVNANLVFANADNLRVGINTGSPDATLAVNGTANVSGNVVIGGLVTAANASFTNGSFASFVNVGANVYINTTGLFVGNATVNTFINSTAFSGQSNTAVTALTANNSTNFAGQGQSYYANVTNPSFSTSVNVGSAVQLNTTALTVGTAVVNSTFFTATANNALTANNSTNFAGQGQSYYANVTSPSFATSVGVGANVTLNTSALSIGNSTSTTVSNSTTVTVGNTTVNVSINSTAFTGTSNNATYFAGQPGSFYANVTNPNFSVSVNVGANLQLNSSAVFLGNTLTSATINTSAVIVGNSTVNVTINSTSFNGTVNNATNFAGQGQSYYANITNPTFVSLISVGSNVTVNTTGLFVGNSTVNTFVNSTFFTGQANSALNANQALTANNSTNFAGQGQSYYANVTNPSFSTSINVGASIQLNTTALTIGSAVVNSSFFTGQANQALTANNSTNFAGQGQSYYANVTNPSFSTSIGVGSNVTLNTSALFIGNATVNATIGSTVSVFSSNVGIGNSAPTALSTLSVNGQITSANLLVTVVTNNTYTFTANDSGTTITFNNTTVTTVTIPASLPVGWRAYCLMLGTGNVTFTNATGTTMVSPSTNSISTRYGTGSVFCYAANSYVLSV